MTVEKKIVTNCHPCHLAGRVAPAQWADADDVFYCGRCMRRCTRTEAPSLDDLVPIADWLKAHGRVPVQEPGRKLAAPTETRKKSRPEKKISGPEKHLGTEKNHREEPSMATAKKKGPRICVECHEPMGNRTLGDACKACRPLASDGAVGTLMVTEHQVNRMVITLPFEQKVAAVQNYLDNTPEEVH